MRTARSLGSDYYPFGMMMPHPQNTQPGGHSFGFQGQLADDEMHGDQNSYAFKARIHDPRIGRFMSIDPLAKKYPHNSPYAFSENRVIDSYEREGKEAISLTSVPAAAAGTAGQVATGVLYVGGTVLVGAAIYEGAQDLHYYMSTETTGSKSGGDDYGGGYQEYPSGGGKPPGWGFGERLAVGAGSAGIIGITVMESIGGEKALDHKDALTRTSDYPVKQSFKIKGREYTAEWTGHTVTPTSIVDNVSISVEVKSGETLSGLAKKFNTTVDQLQKMNDLGDKTKIEKGQKLTVIKGKIERKRPPHPAGDSSSKDEDSSGDGSSSGGDGSSSQDKKE